MAGVRACTNVLWFDLVPGFPPALSPAWVECNCSGPPNLVPYVALDSHSVSRFVQLLKLKVLRSRGVLP